MKILRLTLKNFKGVKSFTLDAQGENMTIRGNNATGKTTLFDSFLWLLFDKDSQNKSKFEIKTLDAAGSALHGLDHEVEAVLEVGGKEVTLRKSYKEKWTQKRGSAEKVFEGHTTDYYINEVPVPKKEYVSQIAEIADEDVFKLLTNPKHFNEQLKWEKRREILLSVCGDVSDAEVIASDNALAELPEILGDCSLEKYKEMIKAKCKKINEELKALPVRIDEVYRGLPDITGIDAEKTLEKIEILKSSVRKKNQEIDRIESGGEVAEKVKQLRVLEGELQEIRNKHSEAIQEKIRAKSRELNEYSTDTESTIARLKKEEAYTDAKVMRLEDKMKDLRAKWIAEDEKEFTFEQSDTCPTCGQNLPGEQLEEARQKALEAFNLAKAEKLQAISCAGKELKKEKEKLTSEIEEIGKQVGKLLEQQVKEEKVVAKLQEEIQALQLQAGNLPPACVKKQKQIDSLKEVIAGLKDGSSDEKAKLYEQIAAIEESIRDAEKLLADIANHKQGQKRIEELKEQEEKLAAEYGKLEQHLFLTEEFTRAKVALLEERINGRFRVVKFKMFNTLINGGLEDCCETIVNGVPYSSGLNYGHQIIGGLDIINTLSEHYNFFPPIFVDNSEAVTDLPETKAQVIRLVKPEILTDADRKKYGKLVVEVQEKIMEEAV